LADLIRQLPTGYQTIFNLYAVEGFTHIEIGAMLGIHEGTSRSQYARARALLISWIENKNVVTKQQYYAGK
jgi:RNA polymerase sigma-70 factor (ECF subfamily)